MIHVLRDALLTVFGSNLVFFFISTMVGAIAGCSVDFKTDQPDPQCISGQRVCQGNAIVECRKGAWYFERNCSQFDMICRSSEQEATCEAMEDTSTSLPTDTDTDTHTESETDTQTESDTETHSDGDTGDPTATDSDTGDGNLTGLGVKCTAQGDCSGYDADYCAIVIGTGSGYCVIRNCSKSPDTCPTQLGFRCCKMPAYTSFPSICIPQDWYNSLDSSFGC